MLFSHGSLCAELFYRHLRNVIAFLLRICLMPLWFLSHQLHEQPNKLWMARMEQAQLLFVLALSSRSTPRWRYFAMVFKIATVCGGKVCTMSNSDSSLTVNRTRFIVLSIRAEPEPSRAPLYRTLLRLSLPSNSLALGKSIASLSKSEDCIISRIDRRPSMHPTPFHDAVFVEVASDQKGQENLGSWRTTISKLVERVKSEVEDAEYTILGAW
jgi:hypothetical protein